jgi:hypothetical protein
MPTAPVPARADSVESTRTEVDASDDGATSRHGPGSEVHSSRVTIAFPFSQIKTQEPSAELAELAALLVDVVAALQEACPDAPLAALAERAEALKARVG